MLSVVFKLGGRENDDIHNSVALINDQGGDGGASTFQIYLPSFPFFHIACREIIYPRRHNGTRRQGMYLEYSCHVLLVNGRIHDKQSRISHLEEGQEGLEGETETPTLDSE